jgi:hypothetical protein
MRVTASSTAMRTIRAALLLALAALGAAAPLRADALRCGSKLVAEGDTRAAVEARCGPPADVARRTRLAPAVVWRHGRPYHVGEGPIDVVVEEWTYNFGPQRFMRRVRFEDGIVVRIDTLGYGHRSAHSTH